MFQHFVQDAEGGIDVNGIILLPLDGEEVDMGAVLVVESGAELWELAVEGGGHGINLRWGQGYVGKELE